MATRGVERRLVIVACSAVASLAAAEHHGHVTFGGLPVPGTTITAVQGDQKLVAITDPQGAYSFPNLPDGVWHMQVDMLCFAPIREDVAVAPDAPSPTWELKLLPFDEIKASAPPPPPPSAPQPAATSKAATSAQVNPKAGFQRTDVNASGDATPPADDTATPAGDANQSASLSLIHI